MFEKLFQPGNRKLIITLVGVLLTMFGDKLGITMDDKMQETIVYLVGIFTGGNVLSKVAYSVGNKTSVDVTASPSVAQTMQAEEDNMSVESHIEPVRRYAQQIAADATKELNNVHLRCKQIEDHVAKQSKSINDLILLINQTRTGNVPPAPPVGPQRVPTPNELYNQG